MILHLYKASFYQLTLLAIWCLSLVICVFDCFLKVCRFKFEEMNGCRMRIGAIRDLAYCIVEFGLIVTYAVSCNEGLIAWKASLYVSIPELFLSVAVLVLAGACTLRESTKARVMNADITTEIKGWMQALILLYHFTQSYNVVPIFVMMRIFVAMYIVLSGFGHFNYYWSCMSRENSQTTKLSFISLIWQHIDDYYLRCWRVVFRLNLLSVVLCILGKRHYMIHYFVPLITFWYCFMAVSMHLCFIVSRSLLYLADMLHFNSTKCIKHVVFLFILTSGILFNQAIYSNKWLLKGIFFAVPQKYIFGNELNNSQNEWVYRWSLDRYAISFGLFLGYLNICVLPIVNSKLDSLVSFTCGLILCITSGFISSIVMMVYFVKFSLSHGYYASIHPYLSFVPVMILLILRHLFVMKTYRVSRFFIWMGRISLELFVLQGYIWMTRNQTAVLLFIKNQSFLNYIVITLIFFVCCHRVNLLTGRIYLSTTKVFFSSQFPQ